MELEDWHKWEPITMRQYFVIPVLQIKKLRPGKLKQLAHS